MVAVAMTDPADVAAVIATALAEVGHIGKTYRVSGPEALTPADQVAIVADVLERKLRFEVVLDDEARVTLPAQLGQAYADAQFDIFRDHPQYESRLRVHQPAMNGASTRAATMVSRPGEARRSGCG